jgi:hypothetical protein
LNGGYLRLTSGGLNENYNSSIEASTTLMNKPENAFGQALSPDPTCKEEICWGVQLNLI